MVWAAVGLCSERILTTALRSGRSQYDGDDQSLDEVCDLHFELSAGFREECCYELDSEVRNVIELKRL
jgi:hypothetical protein